MILLVFANFKMRKSEKMRLGVWLRVSFFLNVWSAFSIVSIPVLARELGGCRLDIGLSQCKFRQWE